MRNLLLRSLSAVVLAPVVILAEWYGDIWFQMLVALMLIFGVREWYSMCRTPGAIPAVQTRMLVVLLGTLYIAAGCLGLVWLRITAEHGRDIVLWVILLVWAADSGAYAAGTLLGGPKLAPRISPKKTWSGLLGGMAAAAATGAAMAHFSATSEGLTLVAAASAVLAVVAALGDLIESHAKRRFGVKDSGSLIPGHGGLLDRIDGLIAAAIGAVIVTIAQPGHIDLWP